MTPGDIPEKLRKTISKQARPILMTHYITGYTALNISWPDRDQADWHTTSTFKPGANTNAGLIAGLNFSMTEHILGDTDIHDVSEFLRKSGVESPPTTTAAGYERAVFDMLYHFAAKGEPVPNIQAKDIDHEVDFKQVAHWIETCEMIPDDRKAVMLAWLEISDW